MLPLWDVLAAVLNLPIACVAFGAAVENERSNCSGLSSSTSAATHFLDVDVSRASTTEGGGTDEQNAQLMMSTVMLAKAATKIQACCRRHWAQEKCRELRHMPQGGNAPRGPDTAVPKRRRMA